MGQRNLSIGMAEAKDKDRVGTAHTKFKKMRNSLSGVSIGAGHGIKKNVVQREHLSMLRDMLMIERNDANTASNQVKAIQGSIFALMHKLE